MSRILRYRNPVICEHIASQYVMSVMTPRVRARTESLRLQVPALDNAIVRWAENAAKVQYALPEKVPSGEVWKRIERSIPAKNANHVRKKPPTLPFGWRWFGMGASFVSLALLFAFFIGAINFNTQERSLIRATPSYMAVMAPNNTKNNQQDRLNTVEFVMTVYQRTEVAPSLLFVQWSERHPRADQTNLHVWAKDQETGALTYIGAESNHLSDPQEGWALDKTTWLAIVNSSHLIVTKNAQTPSASNTLYVGPCIQLKPWQGEVT
ncbi:hypothetical protein [Marinomonas sp. IMCC 4694]|uniref:hypothetical protein n=1 Tax=Marinomonas sp. IMCC 4694 TaxID=2605432 RepID=UPI0011E71F32|nr:hypothetical protein [Marinomonas sp. IMCC 4694]TYL48094.1 hypothetical protein FXV75_09190 [Marinomonas sp. IMCC 4694]